MPNLGRLMFRKNPISNRQAESWPVRGQPARSKHEMEPAHELPNEGARLHEFTLPQKLQAFTTLMTEWAPHLSASEVVFIGWLLANTVNRGKRSGAYSLPQLVNGVPNHRDGGMWTAGTGLS